MPHDSWVPTIPLSSKSSSPFESASTYERWDSSVKTASISRELLVANGPILATAIHNGHKLRSDIAVNTRLSDEERLREENPFTGDLATINPDRTVINHSRFEVDLDRPRSQAVYRTKEDAWGLDLWHTPLSQSMVNRSLQAYDHFYRHMYQYLNALQSKFDVFLVLDIHSYNRRHQSPNMQPDNPEANPDINIGTGTMNRPKWAELVDPFIGDLRSIKINGCHLDVRENVKSKGGSFAHWIHKTFPNSGCALTIDIKKTFMDERSGELYPEVFDTLKKGLKDAVPGLRKSLSEILIA